MHVGILTAPLRKKPLAEVIPWAAQNGIAALEIDVTAGSHLDASNVDDATVEQILSLTKQHNVRISSLAAYAPITGVPEERAAQSQQTITNAINLAARLNVGIVCTMAGMPVPGKSRAKTIAEDLPGAMRPILDAAGEKGIKIALENWFATNIQHLDHWRQVFDVLPDAHFGLNYDPSHLDWQGIDVLSSVYEFRDRIFHVHAKDVAVNESKLKRVGFGGDGWWRYVLPGYGRIRWGEFITTLRHIGYNDVLSIEHEDDAIPAEEGFEKATRYLNSLV
jgi:sugar phosphate isomerase/epimerase